jgi:FeS assembly SUF system protein
MNSEIPQRIPLQTMGNPEPAPAAPVAVPPDRPPHAQPLTAAQVDSLRTQIIETLKTCYDPEVPINIYELGLIYDIDIQPTGAVGIRMTLTSPACPVAGSLPPEVQAKVKAIPDVTAVKVDLVWDPPWDQNRLSDAARLKLGIDW